MRPLLPALLASALAAGCGSTSDTASRDELHPGNFTDVRTTFWTDQVGFGAGFVAERRCADGATVTREHILSCEPPEASTPAFWADVAVETLADGRTSRALVLAGLGHEPAASPRRLALERRASGRWARVSPDGSSEDLPAFDGCDDLEVEQDHVTAAVAARRLALKPGESRDLDRLLVRLPSLDVEKVKRRLTRLDESSYSWEGLSADGSPAWRLDLAFDTSGALQSVAGAGFQHRAVREKLIR
ncbi:MAG: putative glycolipid-binding domain-containing protein [Planctomycetia bacterium]|nr:putative glycolipid-binding domain-containing protein [Planctomycetia bacterium]